MIVPDTGRGFGGKHAGNGALEAARPAKAGGRPISVVWIRQEEFTWACYRPAALIAIKAGLRQRRLVAWEFTNINSGAAALVSPHQIPHAREQLLGSNSPLRQGSCRVLAARANNFARDCFMEELAHAAGDGQRHLRRHGGAAAVAAAPGRGAAERLTVGAGMCNYSVW